MTRAWKPGDVAMVTHKTGEHRAIRVPAGAWSLETGWADCLTDSLVEKVRPLAVIDPENAEQIDRLLALIDDTDHGFTCGSATCGRDTLAAVLREFANPKPDEPTDPAARVKDKYGTVWARVVEDDGKAVYWVSAGSRSRSWESLVEDLSPIEVRP